MPRSPEDEIDRHIAHLERFLTERSEATRKDHSEPEEPMPYAPLPPSETGRRAPAAAHPLPDIYRSASLYFGAAPLITYTYGPLNGTHGLRLDAKGQGALITTSDPAEAHKLLLGLEQAAASLRRRLDFPEDE